MCVAQRFRKSTARTDPTAISALSPSPDDQRDENEGPHECNRKPPPQRLLGKHVPDKQGPRQNRTIRAPVFAAGVRQRKQIVGECLAKSGIKIPVTPCPG